MFGFICHYGITLARTNGKWKDNKVKPCSKENQQKRAFVHLNPIILFYEIKYPGILQQQSIRFRFSAKAGQARGDYWWKQLEGGRFRREARFAIMKCGTFSQSLMSRKLSLLTCRLRRVLSLTNWGRSSWDEWGFGGARGETSSSDVLPLCFSVMNPHLP